MNKNTYRLFLQAYNAQEIKVDFIKTEYTFILICPVENLSCDFQDKFKNVKLSTEDKRQEDT